MRINTNTAAMNTYSNLTSANASKSSSLAKLSSGLRINKAGDDAAGLAISEKMKNQVSGMTQASRNAQDGISLIQTAEGALSETHSILNRMRDLTVQAGNGTNTDDDKLAIQKEIDSLTDEVGRIAKDTQFNTKGLLNGTTGEVKGTPGTPASSTTTVDSAKVETALTGADPDELKAAWTAVKGTEYTGSELTKDIAKLDSKDIDSVVESYNTAADKFNGDNAADIADSSVIAKTKIDGDAVKEAYTTTTTDEVAGTVGSAGKNSFTFQIGANAGENIKIDIANMTSEGLGIEGLDITGKGYVPTQDKDGNDISVTDAALKTIDSAIKSVSEERANLGAVQNRLDHTVSNLATTKENLSEANSRITDVDMAEEMMSFTKSNILSQASTSMLAQANQMPQSVLSLLQ